MEFLRFGSSIPGSYWGCCACCIIQNFNYDPDSKYSIEVVCGDGGEPIDDLFLGKTYKEVFESRLRIGTFNTEDMPNHAFLAILTEYQLTSTTGNKWLRILKENGFEFIRSFDNSVYTGQSLKEEGYEDDWCEGTHANYLFGMFRNIGSGAVENPFQAPKAWQELSGGVMEFCDFVGQPAQNMQDSFAALQASRDRVHRESWDRIGPAKFYKRSELEADGVPVWLAGRRSKNPQELASSRESRNKSSDTPAKAAPFAAKA